MDSQAKEKVFWGAVKNGDGAKSRTEDTEGECGHGRIVGWEIDGLMSGAAPLNKARF